MRRQLARVGLVLLYPIRLIEDYSRRSGSQRTEAQIHTYPETSAGTPDPPVEAAASVRGRAAQMQYIECSLPPGVTLREYRRGRSGV